MSSYAEAMEYLTKPANLSVVLTFNMIKKSLFTLKINELRPCKIRLTYIDSVLQKLKLQPNIVNFTMNTVMPFGCADGIHIHCNIFKNFLQVRCDTTKFDFVNVDKSCYDNIFAASTVQFGDVHFSNNCGYLNPFFNNFVAHGVVEGIFLNGDSDSIDSFTNSVNDVRCRLKHIKVANLKLSQRSIDKIAQYMSCNGCKLQTLYLDDVEKAKQTFDFTLLAGAVTTNKTIKCFFLNGFIQQNADIWLEAFTTNVTIRELNMNRTRIGNDYFFADIVLRNCSLTSMRMDGTMSTTQWGNMAKIFEKNYNLTNVTSYDSYELNISRYLNRNMAITWNRDIRNLIFGNCVCLAPLQLSAYVLLWIFDWLPIKSFWMPDCYKELPMMHLVNHRKKIFLIQNIGKSIARVHGQRELLLVKKRVQ